MLQKTKEIYGEEIKNNAAALFGADPDSLKILDGFENFIYECKIDGELRILRVTHSLHRSQEFIQGEVAWINDLYTHGITVAPSLPSKTGNNTENIPDVDSSTYFTAVAFQHAPGVILDDYPAEKAKYWNNSLFEQWGELMARIHNHAQFIAPGLNIIRPQWDEYDVLDLEKFIPSDQLKVLEVGYSHIEKVKNLPKKPDSFGLTHADMTQWNFKVHGGKITLYDFDSSEYGWFIKDLAVSLYYAGASYEGDDKEGFEREFLKHLLTGYRRVRPISDRWIAFIPDFLFLQRIILYSFSYQLGSDTNPTEETIKFLDRTRDIIESGEEPIQPGIMDC